MPFRIWLETICTLAVLYAVAMIGTSAHAAINASPKTVSLTGPEQAQQILIQGTDEQGRAIDLTRQATFTLDTTDIASINSHGVIRPKKEGLAKLTATVGNDVITIPIKISGLTEPQTVSFSREVIPVLTKAGCNSGACHGKAEGKNGFKLSVFGYDAAGDYEAILKQGRGRRVFVGAPDQSLLLQKGSGTTPHGGGQKLTRDSSGYMTLRRWIAEGAAFDSNVSDSDVIRIEVEPAHRVLNKNGQQQLRVTAISRDGKKQCVTTEAQFESNAADVAQVDEHGWVQSTDVAGEAAILVRYQGHIGVSKVTRPQPRGATPFARPPEHNFIDQHVWNKLELLGIHPSTLVDDATFLRRVYLDTIGTLPTADEAKAFLKDANSDKRAKLIDQLLERPEYADYWAMRWSDILRVDRDAMTPGGAVAVSRWLREQFKINRPYDQFVRDIITANGPISSQGPAAIYKVFKSPDVTSRSMSQVFLGVRIECAQCHHHPSENWSQADYVALAGFFTGVGNKKMPGGDIAIVPKVGQDLKHPRTGETIATASLGAPAADLTKYTDRREALAEWMVAKSNPFLARMIANRLWAHYFGRGIVDPVDDMRATNPATNEPLLAALASELHKQRFDLKALTRSMLNSRVYQLSSTTNDSNANDTQSFSHARYKSLPAEVLYDAICHATGTEPKFIGWPSGYRAVRVWDNQVPSYFFRIFGRPVRATVCECERSNEPSIAQALHLMNSPHIKQRLESPTGIAIKLASSNAKPRDIITTLFLRTLSREPAEREVALMLEAFAEYKDNRAAATQDVLWALLNSKQFIYNH